jgi:hypothetical protein
MLGEHNAHLSIVEIISLMLVAVLAFQLPSFQLLHRHQRCLFHASQEVHQEADRRPYLEAANSDHDLFDRLPYHLVLDQDTQFCLTLDFPAHQVLNDEEEPEAAVEGVLDE